MQNKFENWHKNADVVHSIFQEAAFLKIDSFSFDVDSNLSKDLLKLQECAKYNMS